MTFDKYQIIRNVINDELVDFLFNYLLLKQKAVRFMYENNILYDSGLMGTWSDKQVPNTYSCYADLAMETLLAKVLPVMQRETGLQLVPTYSYTRVYKQGDVLLKHKDRPSCEISTTLNLGGDLWPIFLEPNIQVDLMPGDMLIYSGCDLNHWRDPFEGDVCAQVFLHYNHKNGSFAETNKFDGRAMLGMPAL